MWALSALVMLGGAAFTIPFFMPEGLKSTGSGSYLAPLTRDADSGLLHVCGTDKNGQDLFYRLLTGAQVSLGVGMIGAALALVIGTSYGMVSGYIGGRLDNLMMRTVDMLYAIPRILFIMIFVAVFDDAFKGGWIICASGRRHRAGLTWKPLHAILCLIPRFS
jgi:peptide/nickel transport system permease protein/oligopeptide transport system permease protein